jgi:hypothetical protein
MVGNVVAGPGADINGVDPAAIEIGGPVRVVFSALAFPGGGEVWLPQWVRDRGPGLNGGTWLVTQGPGFRALPLPPPPPPRTRKTKRPSRPGCFPRCAARASFSPSRVSGPPRRQ